MVYNHIAKSLGAGQPAMKEVLTALETQEESEQRKNQIEKNERKQRVSVRETIETQIIAVQIANAEKKVTTISGRISQTIPETRTTITTAEEPEKTTQTKEQETIVT